VPIVKALPDELLEDCAPEPLAGTRIGQALGREASVEDCLSTLRGRLARLRAINAAGR
jgi:hypothetical protein